MKYVYLALILIIPILGFTQRSEQWLKANKHGDRSEGKYSKKVGNGEIRLVSFIEGKKDYEFKKKQKLSVTFYSPDTKEYTIKAEELKPNKFYWMESTQKSIQVGKNKLLDWPVDFLLKRMEVPSDDLGIVVRQGNKNSKIFLPVKLFHGSEPERFARYTAHFYLGRNVSKGYYEVYKGKNKTEANLIKKAKIGEKDAGEPFSILLSRKIFPTEGWYSVVLKLYKSGNLKPIDFEFSFYHKP